MITKLKIYDLVKIYNGVISPSTSTSNLYYISFIGQLPKEFLTMDDILIADDMYDSGVSVYITVYVFDANINIEI